MVVVVEEEEGGGGRGRRSCHAEVKVEKKGGGGKGPKDRTKSNHFLSFLRGLWLPYSVSQSPAI